MPLSIQDAQAQLVAVMESLPLTLNQALERFTPDADMKKLLKGYLEVWGERPLHEFMIGVIASGDPGEPDIWNGDMQPFNILQILDTVYRS